MVMRKFVQVLPALMLAGTSLAQTPAREPSEADYFGELPTVLTASRLIQPLMDAPNAITVVDRRLIEASGYHNVYDLLRFVPGFYVGQHLHWQQTVTRTLGDPYSPRLQVLVDGRSIYQPTFGGVRWDALPLSVDDIERIEAVRGPATSSYGANAFTGVINIITRHPEDVAGRMLRFIAGDLDHRETWFRWAGSTGASAHRVTMGRGEDDGSPEELDYQRTNLFNYRGDFDLAGGSGLSLQAGYSRGDRGLRYYVSMFDQPHEQHVEQFSLAASYVRPLSAGRELLVKASLDDLDNAQLVPVTYPVPGSAYRIDLESRRWHGEFQINSQHGHNLRSTLGAYLRRDEVRSEVYYGTPDALSVNSWGAFIHGEWRLASEWLLNVGTFFEDYALVDSHWSPRASLHWQPSPNQSFRFGLARAYRNPVMLEARGNYGLEIQLPQGSTLGLRPLVVALSRLAPESMISQEIGYQGLWPQYGLNLDMRLYRERIDDLIDVECPAGNIKLCGINNFLIIDMAQPVSSHETLG